MNTYKVAYKGLLDSMEIKAEHMKVNGSTTILFNEVTCEKQMEIVACFNGDYSVIKMQ